MNNVIEMQWKAHHCEVISCRRCPRLVAWREEVARVKRKAYFKESYWGKPVPGFGDHGARVMILGLAPGAHGSNRTGRMFTGDASGDFLYPALYRAGFASQQESKHIDDGLALDDIFITAVCRCAPPGNKPTREEQQTCRPYLLQEMRLLENLQGIVALGGIAFAGALNLMQEMYGDYDGKKPQFSYNALYRWQDARVWLLGAYHPSRQNTQTGRLTKTMFAEVWEGVNRLLEEEK
jgi:uracil-DNA glycosylase family 4